MHLSVTNKYLRTFSGGSKEYRQTGIEKCLSDACEFIEKNSNDLPNDFKNKRLFEA